MSDNNPNEMWRPSAALSLLRQRAELLHRIRLFFAERNVLEVETPVLSHAASSEVHLETLQVNASGMATTYLHTSPELAMKRLLASGSGDIYQICKVFRGGEQGGQHNPEFTLLEWYRINYDMEALMREVAELCAIILVDRLRAAPLYLSYRQAFLDHAHIDPLTASNADMQQCFEQAAQQSVAGAHGSDWWDLVLSFIVQPNLPADRLVFLTDFPAAQASLARLNPHDPRVARRFEVFMAGVELANGFEELTDFAEQQQRIESEQTKRQTEGLPCLPVDRNFLAALQAGLPPCSGVALGVDRLVMLACQQERISEVLSFDFDRA